jgi:redox-sensitive bicupin YhaK (pirin superfamily)
MKGTIDTCTIAAMNFMAVQKVAPHGVTHPFGDERSVYQAFPAAIPKEQADPFLMFDAIESTGKASNEDEFPVNWHPHRGFDIASYLRSGTGRHADSLGNRETYETPGMQWMSTGSGVEHAEGGANDMGQRVHLDQCSSRQKDGGSALRDRAYKEYALSPSEFGGESESISW